MTFDDNWGTTARDWITVIDQDNWLILVSDGTTVTISKGDYGVEVHHVNPMTGETTEFDGTPFPYRPGAMEAVRKWLASSGLTMVPSPDQAAAPWRNGGHDATERATRWDHSYRAKYDAAKQSRVIAHADAASNDTGFDNGRDHPPNVPPDFDPMAFAASLSLSSEPPPDDPFSVERGAGYHVDNVPPVTEFDADAFARQLAEQMKGSKP